MESVQTGELLKRAAVHEMARKQRKQLAQPILGLGGVCFILAASLRGNLYVWLPLLTLGILMVGSALTMLQREALRGRQISEAPIYTGGVLLILIHIAELALEQRGASHLPLVLPNLVLYGLWWAFHWRFKQELAEQLPPLSETDFQSARQIIRDILKADLRSRPDIVELDLIRGNQLSNVRTRLRLKLEPGQIVVVIRKGPVAYIVPPESLEITRTEAPGTILMKPVRIRLEGEEQAAQITPQQLERYQQWKTQANPRDLWVPSA